MFVFNSNLKVWGSDMAAAEQKQLLQHFDLLIPGKVNAIYNPFVLQSLAKFAHRKKTVLETSDLFVSRLR